MANTDARRITLTPDSHDRLQQIKPEAGKPEMSDLLDRILKGWMSAQRITLTPESLALLQQLRPGADRTELSQYLAQLIRERVQLTQAQIFPLPYWVELFEPLSQTKPEQSESYRIKCGDRPVSDPLTWGDAYAIAKALNADTIAA